MTTERTMKKYYGPSGYVKPLSVEDGMDEHKCDCWKRERQVCDICQGVDSQTAAADLDELLRNVRSATPEELTAQAESYGKNYKPGPRQATPIMPEPVGPPCGGTMSEERVLPPIERMERTVKCDVCGWYTPGVPQSESWALHETIAALRASLAQSEAERERLQEVVRMYRETRGPIDHHRGCRGPDSIVTKDDRCVCCRFADALLAPAPVVTGEEK